MSFDDPLASECPPPPDTKKRTHWIEIELLDEDTGEPVKGATYQIKLTDGKIYDGTLDDNGRARYDGIEAGTCYVWFPAIDGMVWNKTVTASPDEPEPNPPEEPSTTGGPVHLTGWIDVRLVDDAGKPIMGERFELQLTNGKIEYGVTDEDGGIFFDDIEIGTCQICFPDLDGESWEAA